jgi:PIN domain nuclease of toxin-antitoxin system
MNDILADTHSVVWFLFDPNRLSPAATAAMNAAVQSGRLFISTITLVELSYLAGRPSFPYSRVLPRLITLIDDPSEPIEALPLTVEVARTLDVIPRSEIADMPDRIVAATAVTYQLPLVSVDSDIQSSRTLKNLVPVIW